MASVRFVVLAGVASSILLAAVLFIAALVRAVYESVDALSTLGQEKSLRTLVAASVRHADVLLIATAMLLVGVGLYSIFIDRVEHAPRWLAIRGFEDLKQKLASVVVIALVVDFFTVALEWDGSKDIMAFGTAIATVLIGFSVYTFAHHLHPESRRGGRLQERNAAVDSADA